MYLTFAEYQIMGGTLDESTFNDLEYQAEMQINWYTFNRLTNDTEYPEAVKRCVYALIKLLYQVQLVTNVDTQSSNINAGISSQSNDGVSISYNVLSASDLKKSSDDEIKKCIEMYLQTIKNSLGRRLLYRGVYPDE